MKHAINIPFMIERIWIEHDYCENTGEKFLPYPGFKDRGGTGASFTKPDGFRSDLMILFHFSRAPYGGKGDQDGIDELINASNRSMRRS